MAESRWRPIHVRLWRHPGFRALTPTAQRLTFYVLTGPQSNRVGLTHFSTSSAAEDLDVTAETIRKGLADLGQTFGWLYDAAARVLYIPSWWRWNPPQNPKHLQGCLKDLAEVPPCALVDAFSRNLQTLPDTLHETFIEGCRIRLPRGTGNQNLNLNLNQKQDQDTRASRGAETGQFGRDSRFDRICELVEAVIPLTSRRDVEHLCDMVAEANQRADTRDQLDDLRLAEIVTAVNTVNSNRRLQGVA